MGFSVNASRRFEIDLFNIDSCFDNIIGIKIEGFEVSTGYTFEIKNLQNEIVELGQTLTIRENELILFIPEGIEAGSNLRYTIKSDTTDQDTKYYQFGKIRVI